MKNNQKFRTTAQEKSTLSTGNYTIEFSDGPSNVYMFDANKKKIWIASAADPDMAMQIIEGLILVEHKRFYCPEATPAITVVSKE